jgi:hypothetical protein
VNIAARHRKPSQANPQGGIDRREAPMAISRSAWPIRSGAATRVRFEVKDGKKVRVAGSPGRPSMADKYTPRLKAKYDAEIAKAMTEKFGYKNVMEVPKIEKITLNMGVGEGNRTARRSDRRGRNGADCRSEAGRHPRQEVGCAVQAA